MAAPTAAASFTFSGLVAHVRGVIAERRIDLAALSIHAGIPVVVIRRVLSQTPGRSPHALAAVESCLHAHGARLIAVADGSPYPITLATVQSQRLPAAPKVAARTAEVPTGIVRKPRRSDGPAVCPTLIALLQALLHDVYHVPLATWHIQAATAATGLPTRILRAVIGGTSVPALEVLERILDALGIALDLERDDRTWRWGQTGPIPNQVLVNKPGDRPRTGAKWGGREPLASSNLVRALVSVAGLHGRAGAERALACGITPATLRRWRLQATDQDLAAREAAVVALGGRIRLRGSTSIQIPPLSIPPQRIVQAIRDGASARRTTAVQVTHLAGEALAEELERRVARTRQALLQDLKRRPSIAEEHSLGAWIRARVAQLRASPGGWSTIDVALVAGLSRGTIARLLIPDAKEDAVILLLHRLGLSLIVESRGGK